MADGGRITLGGGCFWCVEAPLLELRGVEAVEPGYAGGDDPSPTYQAVCAGSTGHAEVVRVAYDPEVLPLDVLLRVFFTIHDPTTVDRQGADVGSHYRSVILFEDPEQEPVIFRVMEELEAEEIWPAPFVTEVRRLEEFYPAEPYHLDYYRRNPAQPYCQIVISPKIAKIRKQFSARLRGGKDE